MLFYQTIFSLQEWRINLPDVQETSHDPFMAALRKNDFEKYHSQKWGSNQKFINQRRFDLCIDLIKKHITQLDSPLVGDFACGTAIVGTTLAEEGFQVELIENESKFFEYIKLKTKSENLNCIVGDVSTYKNEARYSAIFLGEAIEHMARPAEVLKNLYQSLRPGGILCMTTPNGDFVNCYEPNWSEVKDQAERNEGLANTFGNHVCEFTPAELKELTKLAGFCILEHRFIQSSQICKSSLLRRLTPRSLLWKLDEKFSNKRDSKSGKLWGMNQVVVAQRARS